MARIQINIDTRLLQNKLQKISDSLPDIVSRDISSAVDDGVQVAKGLARVKTGYMRDHIHGDQADKYKYQFKSDATYSSYQDMGTRYISGTHFMSEGSKTIRDKAVLAIREDIGALVRQEMSNEDITIGIEVTGADTATEEVNNFTAAVKGISQVDTSKISDVGPALDTVKNAAQGAAQPLTELKTGISDFANVTPDAVAKGRELESGLKDLRETSGSAGSNFKEFASSMTTAVGSIASVASGIVSMAMGYTQMERAQLSAEKASTRYNTAKEVEQKLQDKLNQLIASGDTSSAKYRQTVTDLAIAHEKTANAAENASLSQSHANESMAYFMTTIAPNAIAIVGGVAQAITAVPAAASKMKDSFSAMTSGMSGLSLSSGLALGAIGALAVVIALVATNAFGFRDRLNEMGKAIGDAVPILQPLLLGLKMLGERFGLTGSDAKTSANDVDNAMKDADQSVHGFASSAISELQRYQTQIDNMNSAAAAGEWKGYWSQFADMATNNIQSAIRGFYQMGVDIGENIKGNVKAWGEMLNSLGASAQAAGGLILEGIKGGLDQAGQWFKDNVTDPITSDWNQMVDEFNVYIADPISAAFSATESWFKDNVSDPITSDWNQMVDEFNVYIADPINAAFNATESWFKSSVSDPITSDWNALKAIFDANIADPISKTFAGTAEWFKTNVSDPIHGFFDWLSKLNIPNPIDWLSPQKAYGQESGGAGAGAGGTTADQLAKAKSDLADMQSQLAKEKSAANPYKPSSGAGGGDTYQNIAYTVPQTNPFAQAPSYGTVLSDLQAQTMKYNDSLQQEDDQLHKAYAAAVDYARVHKVEIPNGLLSSKEGLIGYVNSQESETKSLDDNFSKAAQYLVSHGKIREINYDNKQATIDLANSYKDYGKELDATKTHNEGLVRSIAETGEKQRTGRAALEDYTTGVLTQTKSLQDMQTQYDQNRGTLDTYAQQLESGKIQMQAYNLGMQDQRKALYDSEVALSSNQGKLVEFNNELATGQPQLIAFSEGIQEGVKAYEDEYTAVAKAQGILAYDTTVMTDHNRIVLDTTKGYTDGKQSIIDWTREINTSKGAVQGTHDGLQFLIDTYKMNLPHGLAMTNETMKTWIGIVMGSPAELDKLNKAIDATAKDFDTAFYQAAKKGGTDLQTFMKGLPDLVREALPPGALGAAFAKGQAQDVLSSLKQVVETEIGNMDADPNVLQNLRMSTSRILQKMQSEARQDPYASKVFAPIFEEFVNHPPQSIDDWRKFLALINATLESTGTAAETGASSLAKVGPAGQPIPAAIDPANTSLSTLTTTLGNMVDNGLKPLNDALARMPGYFKAQFEAAGAAVASMNTAAAGPLQNFYTGLKGLNDALTNMPGYFKTQFQQAGANIDALATAAVTPLQNFYTGLKGLNDALSNMPGFFKDQFTAAGNNVNAMNTASAAAFQTMSSRIQQLMQQLQQLAQAQASIGSAGGQASYYTPYGAATPTGPGYGAGSASYYTPYQGVFAQHGFTGIVDKPTSFVVGEAGPEYVSVIPGGGAGQVSNVLFTGLQDMSIAMTKNNQAMNAHYATVTKTNLSLDETNLTLKTLGTSTNIAAHALAGSGLQTAADTASGSVTIMGQAANGVGQAMFGLPATMSLTGTAFGGLAAYANSTGANVGVMGMSAQGASQGANMLGSSAANTATAAERMGQYATTAGGNLSGMGSAGQQAGQSLYGAGQSASQAGSSLQQAGNAAGQAGQSLQGTSSAASGASGSISGLSGSLSQASQAVSQFAQSVNSAATSIAQAAQQARAVPAAGAAGGYSPYGGTQAYSQPSAGYGYGGYPTTMSGYNPSTSPQLAQWYANQQYANQAAYYTPYGASQWYGYAKGFEGIVSTPTKMVVGEAGPEYVSIIPGVSSNVGDTMASGLAGLVTTINKSNTAMSTTWAAAQNNTTAFNSVSGALGDHQHAINTNSRAYDDNTAVTLTYTHYLDNASTAINNTTSALDDTTTASNNTTTALGTLTNPISQAVQGFDGTAGAANNATSAINNMANSMQQASASIAAAGNAAAAGYGYGYGGGAGAGGGVQGPAGAFAGLAAMVQPNGGGPVPAVFAPYAQYGNFSGTSPAPAQGAAYYGGPPATGGGGGGGYGAFGAYAQYGNFSAGTPTSGQPGSPGVYGGPPSSQYGAFGGLSQYGNFSAGTPGGGPQANPQRSPYGAFGGLSQYGQFGGGGSAGGPQGSQGGAYQQQASPASSSGGGGGGAYYGAPTYASNQYGAFGGLSQFGQFQKSYQHGFEGIVSRATSFIAGEAGPEYVSVKPLRTNTGIDVGGIMEMIAELVRQLRNQSINVNVNSFLDGYTVYKNQQKYQRQSGNYYG